MSSKRSIIVRTLVLLILGIVTLLVCIGIIYYITKSGNTGVGALNHTLVNLTKKINGS